MAPCRRVSQHPTPGAKKPASASERSDRTVSQDERPIEAADVGRASEKPDRFRSILDNQQKGPRGAGDSSVELGEELRPEDGQEPLADLASVKSGGCAGVIHRSGAEHHAVFGVRIHRFRGLLRRPAVAVHPVTCGEAMRDMVTLARRRDPLLPHDPNRWRAGQSGATIRLLFCGRRPQRGSWVERRT